MIDLASPSLRSAALALALAGCTERDPLGTGSVSASASSTGTDPETGSSGTPTGGGTPGTTSEGPSPPPTTTTTTDSATTDSATTALDTGDPAGTDVSGQFLLAVSTVLAPNLPLQFLATTTQTAANGQTWLSLELQPLSLDQGKVTTPREPVGDPIFLMGVPVVDGMFEFDAVPVTIVGAANPITGSEITATLSFKMGRILIDDFFCGDVEGEVITPLMAQLNGSTFAAMRIAGLEDLTNGVAINCASEIVLDP